MLFCALSARTVGFAQTENLWPPEPPTVEGVPAQEPRVAGEVMVAIYGSFSPLELRIKAGTAVVWTNRSRMRHTVTSDSGLFDSALLKPEESFKHTFNEPGSFPYHCRPHPFMKGTVIVE